MRTQRRSVAIISLVAAGMGLSIAVASTAHALFNPGSIGLPGKPIGGRIGDPLPLPSPGLPPPPPQPTPTPDFARPSIKIDSRASGTMTIEWCDRSGAETGNHLWVTSDPEAPLVGDVAAAGGRIVADLPAGPNGCKKFVDGSLLVNNPGNDLPVAQALAATQSLGGIALGTLQPDTLYCYQIVPHDFFSEYVDYKSGVVCSYTRERPSRSVYRAQLVLRTASGSDDGTDDPVNVALNRRYLGALYEYLAGDEQPFGNMTRLDRPGDDHERGAVEVYDLNLSRISDLGDITEISIEKDGDDMWCLSGVALVINDETLFSEDFSPCRRATNESVLYVSHEDLRAAPAWASYRTNLVPADAATRLLNGQTVPILEISRGDLEKRIEGVVGDSISGNSLEWRGSKGVEETPVDERTAHVELDLQADVTGPNPSVDIGFDLQFAMACNGNGIDFSITTPPDSLSVSADASVTSYILAGLFCSGIDSFVGQDCPVGIAGAIETQVQKKFTPIANVIRFDLGSSGAACGTVFKPVARVTAAGALVIEVQSLVTPPTGPQPTAQPTPKPTPAPTVAPPVGIVSSTLRLGDDPTAPVDPLLQTMTFKSLSDPESPGGVVEPAFGSAADPTIGGAELVVYRVGGDAGDVTRIALPASRWRRIQGTVSPAYKYVDRNSKEGPITKVRIQSGNLLVRGHGDGLYGLADAPQGQMAVRLRMGGGLTWCATAPAKPPLATNDSTSKFLGVPDSPPPITCPAIPDGQGSATRAFLDAPSSLFD